MLAPVNSLHWMIINLFEFVSLYIGFTLVHLRCTKVNPIYRKDFGQHCPINIQEVLIKPRRVATRGGMSPGVSYLQQRGRGLFAGGEEENQIC